MFSKLMKKIGKTRKLHFKAKYTNKDWLNKRVAIEQISEKITNGSHIFIGSGSATAHATLNAIVNSRSYLLDINILQFAPGGKLPHIDKNTNQFRITSLFAYQKVADKVEQGVADYIPTSTAKLHRMFEEKIIPVDVAVVKVTPPDENGWCSLGLGVDLTFDAVKNAKIVIAELCEYMPWTYGESTIHVSNIDWWTEVNQPLPANYDLFPQEYLKPIAPDILEKIAKNVLFEIPDGATLKFDISVFTSNLIPFLETKKNLGLHTDLLNDQLLELLKKGVITNSQKTVNTGISIVGHAYGSQELIEYVHKNPNIAFYSSYQINRLDKMANQDNLIYLLGGLKVDLNGQVAVDSLGNRLYGGVGSSDDSIRGAGYSKGGKPIVVLPSKSIKGKSNIVMALPEGTGVVITRLDIHYVITEYGTAFLFGKTIRERCLALIEIAHPDFRKQLLQQAKLKGYIHSQQSGLSYTTPYPKQWEQIFATHSNKQVLVRPIKAIDEDRLRDFFHKLSDQNVYMRYFTQIRSLPQKVLKSFTDIDYSKDMALVAISPPATSQHEIVGIAQWIIDPQDGIPEIAFQISDSWHKEGLGRFFFNRLFQIASQNGFKELRADVLSNNYPMNTIIETSDICYKRTSELGIYSYTFFLD